MTTDFRTATDELFKPISHDDLARYLEKSVAAVRQARLDPSAKAYRKPPEGWEEDVANLAETRGYELLNLAGSLYKVARKAKRNRARQ